MCLVPSDVASWSGGGQTNMGESCEVHMVVWGRMGGNRDMGESLDHCFVHGGTAIHYKLTCCFFDAFNPTNSCTLCTPAEIALGKKEALDTQWTVLARLR